MEKCRCGKEKIYVTGIGRLCPKCDAGLIKEIEEADKIRKKREKKKGE